jgi:hypothetical protein
MDLLANCQLKSIARNPVRAHRAGVWLLVAICLLAYGRAVNSAESLEVRVSPTVAIGPATLHIYATVQPDDANRSVEVAIDSESYYSSSEIGVEGSKGPRVMQFDFRDVPAGSYSVTARLYSNGGVRAVANVSATLITHAQP